MPKNKCFIKDYKAPDKKKPKKKKLPKTLPRHAGVIPKDVMERVKKLPITKKEKDLLLKDLGSLKTFKEKRAWVEDVEKTLKEEEN